MTEELSEIDDPYMVLRDMAIEGRSLVKPKYYYKMVEIIPILSFIKRETEKTSVEIFQSIGYPDSRQYYGFVRRNKFPLVSLLALKYLLFHIIENKFGN